MNPNMHYKILRNTWVFRFDCADYAVWRQMISRSSRPELCSARTCGPWGNRSVGASGEAKWWGNTHLKHGWWVQHWTYLFYMFLAWPNLGRKIPLMLRPCSSRMNKVLVLMSLRPMTPLLRPMTRLLRPMRCHLNLLAPYLMRRLSEQCPRHWVQRPSQRPNQKPQGRPALPKLRPPQRPRQRQRHEQLSQSLWPRRWLLQRADPKRPPNRRQPRSQGCEVIQCIARCILFLGWSISCCMKHSSIEWNSNLLWLAYLFWGARVGTSRISGLLLCLDKMSRGQKEGRRWCSKEVTWKN